MTAPLPLSVWPVTQRPSRSQRAGRYLPASMAHPAKMAPELARRAIAAYSRPGDLVVDPLCGIGTGLVEAVHLGRDALGVEYEARWAALARANLAFARARGAPGHGRVIDGDARHLGALVGEVVRGQVGLVLTSPPYGPSTHGQVRTSPRGVTKRNHAYSADPANLARRGLPELLGALGQILAGCGRLLRPGGFVVLTARPWRRAGELVDFPGELERVAAEAGLHLFERNVALLAGLVEDRLAPRASFFQLERVREARRAGRPLRVIAHEDVLVFRVGLAR